FSDRVRGSLSSRVGRVKSDTTTIEIRPICAEFGIMDPKCLFELQSMDEVTFGRADASLGWRLTPTLDMSFGLFFAMRRSEGQDANTRGASLGFAWRANALEL